MITNTRGQHLKKTDLYPSNEHFAQQNYQCKKTENMEECVQKKRNHTLSIYWLPGDLPSKQSQHWLNHP